MNRYIDAEKTKEYKFADVQFEPSFVSNGREKTDDEIYAYKVGYNEAIDNIADFAPTANAVERKRGIWIQGRCTECGYDWGRVAPIARVPNFCPGCGAIMK